MSKATDVPAWALGDMHRQRGVPSRLESKELAARSRRSHEVGGELLHLHPTEGDDIEQLIEMNEVRDAVADLPERLRRVIVGLYHASAFKIGFEPSGGSQRSSRQDPGVGGAAA